MISRRGKVMKNLLASWLPAAI